MKEYTFEANGFHSFQDLRRARKKALQISKDMNMEVYITMLNLANYKQSWYTAYPDGRFTEDGKNLSFNN